MPRAFLARNRTRNTPQRAETDSGFEGCIIENGANMKKSRSTTKGRQVTRRSARTRTLSWTAKEAKTPQKRRITKQKKGEGTKKARVQDSQGDSGIENAAEEQDENDTSEKEDEILMSDHHQSGTEQTCIAIQSSKKGTEKEQNDGDSDTADDELSSTPPIIEQYVKCDDGYELPVFECIYCGKQFKKRYLLKRHFPMHTGERRFVCSICGQAFARGSTLSQHSIVHKEDRNFVCKICGKGFHRSSILNSHMKTHSEQYQYRCPRCNKGFHQKGNLKNHIYTHTGEKPNPCQLCNKKFIQLSNLQLHIKRMHGGFVQYDCAKCDASFAKRWDLRLHEIKTHAKLDKKTEPNKKSNEKKKEGVSTEDQTDLTEATNDDCEDCASQCNQDIPEKNDVVVVSKNSDALKIESKTDAQSAHVKYIGTQKDGTIVSVFRKKDGVPLLVKVKPITDHQLSQVQNNDDQFWASSVMKSCIAANDSNGTVGMNQNNLTVKASNTDCPSEQLDKHSCSIDHLERNLVMNTPATYVITNDCGKALKDPVNENKQHMIPPPSAKEGVDLVRQQNPVTGTTFGKSLKTGICSNLQVLRSDDGETLGEKILQSNKLAAENSMVKQMVKPVGKILKEDKLKDCQRVSNEQNSLAAQKQKEHSSVNPVKPVGFLQVLSEVLQQLAKQPQIQQENLSFKLIQNKDGEETNLLQIGKVAEQHVSQLPEGITRLGVLRTAEELRNVLQVDSQHSQTQHQVFPGQHPKGVEPQQILCAVTDSQTNTLTKNNQPSPVILETQPNITSQNSLQMPAQKQVTLAMDKQIVNEKSLPLDTVLHFQCSNQHPQHSELQEQINKQLHILGLNQQAQQQIDELHGTAPIQICQEPFDMQNMTKGFDHQNNCLSGELPDPKNDLYKHDSSNQPYSMNHHDKHAANLLQENNLIIRKESGNPKESVEVYRQQANSVLKDLLPHKQEQYKSDTTKYNHTPQNTVDENLLKSFRTNKHESSQEQINLLNLDPQSYINCQPVVSEAGNVLCKQKNDVKLQLQRDVSVIKCISSAMSKGTPDLLYCKQNPSTPKAPNTVQMPRSCEQALTVPIVERTSDDIMLSVRNIQAQVADQIFQPMKALQSFPITSALTGKKGNDRTGHKGRSASSKFRAALTVKELLMHVQDKKETDSSYRGPKSKHKEIPNDMYLVIPNMVQPEFRRCGSKQIPEMQQNSLTLTGATQMETSDSVTIHNQLPVAKKYPTGKLKTSPASYSAKKSSPVLQSHRCLGSTSKSSNNRSKSNKDSVISQISNIVSNSGAHSEQKQVFGRTATFASKCANNIITANKNTSNFNSPTHDCSSLHPDPGSVVSSHSGHLPPVSMDTFAVPAPGTMTSNSIVYQETCSNSSTASSLVQGQPHLNDGQLSNSIINLSSFVSFVSPQQVVHKTPALNLASPATGTVNPNSILPVFIISNNVLDTPTLTSNIVSVANTQTTSAVHPSATVQYVTDHVTSQTTNKISEHYGDENTTCANDETQIRISDNKLCSNTQQFLNSNFVTSSRVFQKIPEQTSKSSPSTNVCTNYSNQVTCGNSNSSESGHCASAIKTTGLSTQNHLPTPEVDKRLLSDMENTGNPNITNHFTSLSDFVEQVNSCNNNTEAVAGLTLQNMIDSSSKFDKNISSLSLGEPNVFLNCGVDNDASILCAMGANVLGDIRSQNAESNIHQNPTMFTADDLPPEGRDSNSQGSKKGNMNFMIPLEDTLSKKSTTKDLFSDAITPSSSIVTVNSLMGNESQIQACSKTVTQASQFRILDTSKENHTNNTYEARKVYTRDLMLPNILSKGAYVNTSPEKNSNFKLTVFGQQEQTCQSTWSNQFHSSFCGSDSQPLDTLSDTSPSKDSHCGDRGISFCSVGVSHMASDDESTRDSFTTVLEKLRALNQ